MAFLGDRRSSAQKGTVNGMLRRYHVQCYSIDTSSTASIEYNETPNTICTPGVTMQGMPLISMEISNAEEICKDLNECARQTYSSVGERGSFRLISLTA